MHAATFDAIEYFPTAHLVQMLALVLVPVFVIEPRGHTAQSLGSFEPVTSTKWPAAQPVHAATLDEVEYLPTAHSVHVVAPVLVPVLVIEPAAQSVHDGTVEAVEYLPAAHAVHVVALAAAPVSVIDPAWHGTQND